MADASEHSKNNLRTLSTMKKFHSDGKYWDVQLRIDTKVFKCQRSLLAANSEYFDTMFSSSNFAESNTTNDQPIHLIEIDVAAFEELLSFMYTGDICVKDSNVFPLLFMNDYLRLSTGYVRERCLEHVKSRSRESKPMEYAPDLLGFTHLKGEVVFVDLLNAHICHHLYHYSKDARLMEISFEILNELLRCSKDYILPLHGSANVLLMIIHNWIKHDREGRSQYYSNLMKNVDYANVSSNFSRIMINRLENSLNEVVNLFKDPESHSDLEKFKRIDTNLTDEIGQFDETILFDVSKMQIEQPKVASSSYIILSGLLWKICIGHKKDELIMSLHCDGTKMPGWNCYASAVFTIVSHKEGEDDFVRYMPHTLFSSKKSSVWGPLPFMKWNDLMDSANGYLDDDDSITLRVHVYADVAFKYFSHNWIPS